MGVTQAITSVLAGTGSTSVLDGYLKGIITVKDGTTIGVKVLSHVSGMNTETQVDYQQSGVYEFSADSVLSIHNIGSTTAMGTTNPTGSAMDWFDAQTVGVTTNTSINWNNLAPRPGTSAFAAARNSRFDEVHVVVIDSMGKITGNAGTILEKYLNLSKQKMPNSLLEVQHIGEDILQMLPTTFMV